MAKFKLIEFRLDKVMSLNVGGRRSAAPAPPELELFLRRKHIREYRLDAGTALTIGRRRDNNIVIQDPTVSRNHAKIERAGGRFLLTDLESKNGTFVNRFPVASHWLKNGDVLKIGKQHLLFACDDDQLGAEAVQKSVANAVLVKPREEERQPATVTSIASKRPASDPAGDSAHVLWFLAGSKRRVEIDNGLLKVGRDPSCDIVVGGLLVGKVAFTIGLRRAGYYLSYVGGISIPKVNGQPVRRSMKLEGFDIIEIGSAKLQVLLGDQDGAEFVSPIHAHKRALAQ